MVPVLLCIQILIKLITRSLKTDKKDLKEITKTLIEYMSTCADIIDFMNYSNSENITKLFHGVDVIYGNSFQV